MFCSNGRIDGNYNTRILRCYFAVPYIVVVSNALNTHWQSYFYQDSYTWRDDAFD